MPKSQLVIDQWPVLSATPAGLPPAGHYFIYFKSDGKLYKKTSAGLETEIGSADIEPALVVTIDTAQTIST